MTMFGEPQGRGTDAYRGSFVKAAISAPTSGPTGTGAGTFGWPAAMLYCTTSKALFVNEGTLASPYWYPVDFAQRGLIGIRSDFNTKGVDALAVADTNTKENLGGGVKLSGQGIAETDAGIVVTVDELGVIARLTTTDEVAHLISLSPLGTGPIFQPDTHGPFVVEAEFANVSANTLRENFLGFCGSNADEIDPPVTAATATVSFAATIGDDVAGILVGSALTLATRLMCIHDKGNANATQLVTAAGVNSGVDLPTAATYTRWRVECDQYGNVRYFADKVQIGYAALALDTDEEHSPLFYVASNSTAVKSVDVKSFAAWGVRA
jgi:hypothetical protein